MPDPIRFPTLDERKSLTEVFYEYFKIAPINVHRIEREYRCGYDVASLRKLPLSFLIILSRPEPNGNLRRSPGHEEAYGAPGLLRKADVRE